MESFIYCGVRIIRAAMHPNYSLPSDVPPPTGMTRDEFRDWSKKYCGESCTVEEGKMLRINTSFMGYPLERFCYENGFEYYVHPVTYARLKKSAKNLGSENGCS